MGSVRISPGVDWLCQDFLYAPGWRDPHQPHACVAPNEGDCKLKKSLRATCGAYGGHPLSY